MAFGRDLGIRRTIRRKELRQIVPLADSTIFEMEQKGAVSPSLCAHAAMRSVGSR